MRYVLTFICIRASDIERTLLKVLEINSCSRYSYNTYPIVCKHMYVYTICICEYHINTWRNLPARFFALSRTY